MHSTSHVPGIGQIGPVVDANSGKVLGALTLTRTDGGVRCDTVNLTFEVPVGQIQLIVYAPEEKPKASK